MDLLDAWDYFINEVRKFFKEKGYTEVSTPLLLDFPNLDSNVEPVKVEVLERGENKVKWLHTSPEYSMKKLLSRYKRDIFQITKVFRNNEWGRLHRIEFHMLEWYAVGCDYLYLIEELKQLLNKLFGFKEFEVITVEEAFKRHFGEGIPQEESSMKELLERKGIDFSEDEDWETLFYRAFIEVERHLGFNRPTFLINFPERLCALAKVRNGYAERFELFIKGIELANGWTEETNPEEVRKRLEREAKKRNLPLDEDFIKAHEDMPECAGCSLGIDRLFSLFLGKEELVSEFFRA
ncbi:elongation factor P--(R)-beta-lysine ligase [Aquifex aeolicus]|uniref:Elongation factor P--(R)-beta-lysine ligase homolog n=1 Tax=Aquifex aeolicus (strain VF5) TaxID=224324 RepID=EPMAH_AQUAE|nr:elongation factor P--(R)-beta-lysine ligase [Aquifex aeolicus]O66963.1 RecName: Full=Elongation factor P--(R)-beta-lysine ligase homolog; Short=EF-P--(R)-beta-lysine ligase homolog [Aquifex aeolicus VF5]AAC06920.1 lysyl-tRNA synthetase-like protein [Aquifex aeolicus VF5]